jgi:hypothetical protein
VTPSIEVEDIVFTDYNYSKHFSTAVFLASTLLLLSVFSISRHNRSLPSP